MELHVQSNLLMWSPVLRGQMELHVKLKSYGSYLEGNYVSLISDPESVCGSEHQKKTYCNFLILKTVFSQRLISIKKGSNELE